MNKQRAAVPHSDDFLFSLIQSAIDTNGGYCIGVPKFVAQNSNVLVSDDMIERLGEIAWHILFRTGRSEIVGFKTVMMFLFAMERIRDDLSRYHEKLDEGDCTASFDINIEVSDAEVMQPVVIQRLLKSLTK